MASNPSLEQIQAGLRNRIYLPANGLGGTYEPQIYACMVLLSLSIAMNLISLFQRRKSFWLYRLATTRNGGAFILPHSMIVYLIFNALFSGLLLAYCQVGLAHTVVGSDLRNIIIWKSSIWFFLWFSGWSLAWSTAIQPLLLPGREIDPKSFDFARHPRLVNSVMIITAILFLLAEQICAGISSVHYNNAFSAYQSVDKLLTETIAMVKGGNQLPIVELIAIRGYVGTITTERERFLASYRALWIFGAFFVGPEGIVFGVGATIYFRTLSKSIENLRSQRSSSPASIRQLSSMIQAYRSLTLTCIASLTITAAYFAANVFLAANITLATSGGDPGLMITLAAVYPQAALGPIVSAVILIRGFSHPNSTQSPSNPIPATNINLPRQASKLPLAGESSFISNGGALKIESETARGFYRSESDFELGEIKRDEAPFSSRV